MFHRVRTSSLPHLTEATGYNLIKDTFLPRREERDKGKERERERERERTFMERIRLRYGCFARFVMIT